MRMRVLAFANGRHHITAKGNVLGEDGTFNGFTGVNHDSEYFLPLRVFVPSRTRSQHQPDRTGHQAFHLDRQEIF